MHECRGRRLPWCMSEMAMNQELRTPEESGRILIEPAFDRAADLAEQNRRSRDQSQYDFQGRSLPDLSRSARAEMLDAAWRWTGAYRDIPAPSRPEETVYLAGHQPQLFHPGVWFKNFAIGSLAVGRQATAVNLIVDADVATEAALLVPGGPLGSPTVASIAFDRSVPHLPYEERRIADRELFHSFGSRVAAQIRPLVAHPLIQTFWPIVQRRARESALLGACLAQARHELEGAWGNRTLEVPLSSICRGEAFSWFAAHLLGRLSRFRDVYNDALREYRRLHHVRSLSHPAPELAEEAGWLEAPLWVWTANDPRRRRLFARVSGNTVALSDRRSWTASLPLGTEKDAGRAASILCEWQQGGVRIRPRALVTTLWARIMLGDLFVHGIGGAKYDRVTDRIIERFFGLPAPRFMVVSGTLLLPVERPDNALARAQAMTHQLHELAHHPERFLDGTNDAAAELVAEKRRWIETRPTRENARIRCRALRAINAALQPWVEPRRTRLSEDLAATLQLLEVRRILGSREYAFCLHPEPNLRRFVLKNSEPISPADGAEPRALL